MRIFAIDREGGLHEHVAVAEAVVILRVHQRSIDAGRFHFQGVGVGFVR